jgi:CDGSH-type Zn-finger protein
MRIMARLVKRFRNKPYPITVGEDTEYVCGCGLSNTQPFCDGTHAIAATELPDRLYWYDKERRRYEVPESYAGIRNDCQTKDA